MVPRCKDDPKRAQDGPKRPQEGPKRPQEGPITKPRPSFYRTPHAPKQLRAAGTTPENGSDTPKFAGCRHG